MQLRARCLICAFGASIVVSAFGADERSQSYAGFSLGMSKSEASAIRPETQWKSAMLAPPEKFLRKEFEGNLFDRTATVTVDLDASESFVRMIGFTFGTQTTQQCISDAVRALAALKSQFGEPTEVSHEPPGKRVKWASQSPVVRWGELCAVGALLYYITYAQNGG
ncbi:hypothetical protein [Aquariibacter albus]|uniref:Uncharacterized protein n=1 Tax=Aquariibacter albus TaxID=2759899 RepID=A0A839HRS6_9BURK|nr:hypothetical protein [Aquariibacter albus]MBB1161781.1 hypothetical protein [Aquariibacter albus]